MGSPGIDFWTHVGPCVLLCVIAKDEQHDLLCEK